VGDFLVTLAVLSPVMAAVAVGVCSVSGFVPWRIDNCSRPELSGRRPAAETADGAGRVIA
jgi:hypothetical protein